MNRYRGTLTLYNLMKKLIYGIIGIVKVRKTLRKTNYTKKAIKLQNKGVLGIDLQTNQKRLEYLAYYYRVEQEFNYVKAMHFVLYLEFLEALSYREQGLTMDSYQIPHLIITQKGFTLKDIEFDAQHNAELLQQVIQLKTDRLTLEDIQTMADEVVYYLVLFNVRKRSGEGLYKFSQGFPLYKKYQHDLTSQSKPYVNVKFSEANQEDWDLITSMLMYDDSMILDTPIFYINDLSVIILDYPFNDIQEQHIAQLKQDIHNTDVQEPYVFEFDGKSNTLIFSEDISGL